MNYIDPVKWPEAQEAIRQAMLAEPRGYQADLAVRLGKTRGFVSQIMTGTRPIPVDLLDSILESLNLSYDVVLTRVPKKDGDA